MGILQQTFEEGLKRGLREKAVDLIAERAAANGFVLSADEKETLRNYLTDPADRPAPTFGAREGQGTQFRLM